MLKLLKKFGKAVNDLFDDLDKDMAAYEGEIVYSSTNLDQPLGVVTKWHYNDGTDGWSFGPGGTPARRKPNFVSVENTETSEITKHNPDSLVKESHIKGARLQRDGLEHPEV